MTRSQMEDLIRLIDLKIERYELEQDPYRNWNYMQIIRDLTVKVQADLLASFPETEAREQ